jgi:uncharacterized protein with von Willebrand factor type A (vWA) domain
MEERPLIQRQTSLSANVVAFCRFLRQQGFTIGPAETADALRAVEVLGSFRTPDALQLCLKATLARTLPQQQQFDQLYAQYWRELEKALDSKVKDGEPQPRRQGGQPGKAPSLETLKSWLYGGQPAEEETSFTTYSAREVLARKDFSSFGPEELPELARLIRRLARSLARQFNRRRQKTNRALQLDLRRTLRLNLRRGGEMLDLAHYRPARNRQKIVLLCDVSKSMDLYSRFLVQFIYAFQNNYRRIETFVFSTSLHRVTSQLQQQDFRTMLDELATAIPGWSGGTRIGESLGQFRNQYARRLLNRRTIVIIMSDGWDTGAPELLAEHTRAIQKQAGKLIWLNPLAGSNTYAPTAQGMKAALPYIDVLAPGYNVESLRQLYRHLR